MGDDDLGFDDDKIWFCPPLFMWGVDPYDVEKRRRLFKRKAAKTKRESYRDR